MKTCLIVGAGLSGLIAGRFLQNAGLQVTLLDKGRRAGGRLATRDLALETETAICDHGAQFFTVRDERFQAMVDEWLSIGLVREWTRGFLNENGAGGTDRYPRYCATEGMNAIARHLANGLDVRTSEQVVAIHRTAGQWRIRTKNWSNVETELASEMLVLTPPVPQSLALLDAGNFLLPPAERAPLEKIEYAPCIAAMAALDAPSRIPAPGAIQFNREPIQWIADNRQKGISPVSSLTIHAAPEFSRARWDHPLEETGRMMLDEMKEWIGGNVLSLQVHRWRYSQPTVVHPEACHFLDRPAPLVFAGDAFGGPRVEGAALSGLAAAEKILQHQS